MVEVIWQCPLLGWFKVNTDGAAFGSSGQAGGARIFRDENGSFFACFANYFEIKNVLYAELNASMMAVELAHQRGWNSLWLECDSSLVVNTFKDATKVPWKLAAKWCICKKRLSSMNFQDFHIFREGSACADRLAKCGIASKTFT